MNRCLLILLLISLSGMAAHGQASRGLIREGNDLYKENKYNEAGAAYRQAAEKAPNDYKPKFNLGDALYQGGDYANASEEFKKSAELAQTNSEKSEALYNLGNSYLKNGKTAEAIEAYQKALKLNPGSENIQYNLSYALRKQQQEQSQQQANQHQQQQQEEEKEKDKQQEQPKSNISKEEAEKLLKALENEEQKVRIKLQEKTGRLNQRKESEKPW